MPGVPWSTIKPVILALLTDVAVDQVTSAGGVHEPLVTPKWNAEWSPRKASFIHPLQKQALYLKITSCQAVGWDDTAWVEKDTGLVVGEPATGATNVYQQTGGLRKFVMNVQSWVTEDTEDMSSMHTIERIRTCIDWTSSRARLLAIDVDLTDCGPSRDMSKSIDKRMWSISSMDITFTCAVNDTDPIPVGWIERVILTSHEQQGSTDVDDDLRTINETLPPL